MQHHHSPHSVKVEDLEIFYRSDLKRGLTQQEALVRLQSFGANILCKKKSPSFLYKFLRQFRSALVYLLLIAATVMFIVGKVSDGFIILAAVFINAMMGFIQEERAESSLSSLSKLADDFVRVLRDGHECQIFSSELVIGDLVYLTAGDKVPADCRIVESIDLRLVESALTGESEPIFKGRVFVPMEAPLFERKNMLYAGSLIVQGRALSLVTATAQHTELGKITKVAEVEIPPKTPLENKIETFSKQLGLMASGIFFLMVGLGLLRGLPLADILFVAISEVVSIVPEGLPAAITIALAYGVQRIARKKGVIRSLVAVETLGCVSVICSDKTGTLTRGEMVVSDLYLPGEAMIEVRGIGYAPEGEFFQGGKKVEVCEKRAFHHLIESAVLCNDAKIEQIGENWRILGDPTEGALLTLAKKGLIGPELIVERFPRKGELPFHSENKMMATLHEHGVFIKGAIEMILECCEEVLYRGERMKITQELLREIELASMKTAEEGKRILAFARVEGAFDELTSFSQLMKKGVFLGFVAEVDPPREDAVEAVLLCKKGGIRTIMMTGDHLITAQAIAKQLGILYEGQKVIDGRALDSYSEEFLEKNIGNIAVFARLSPLQKLKIIKALQSNGEVVAMTGDGMNDAPALARADVGIAMGLTGTSLAKEAAKMVIMDDHFSTIVKAIEHGRMIYNNIQKVIFYLLATNTALLILMLGAVCLGLPLPMTAVQILWINIIAEGSVTINLILDPPSGKEMEALPVDRNERIISKGVFLRCFFQIISLSLLLFAYFFVELYRGASMPLLQTKMFTLFAFCAWIKVFSLSNLFIPWGGIERLWKHPQLLIGLFCAMLLQGVVLYVPTMNRLFHTQPLHVFELGILGAVAALLWVIEHIRKRFFRTPFFC